MESIYDFKIRDINGETVDFEQFRGKVLLIVNTASKCGFTPQYEGLEELYNKYKEKGFVVLGFPCDQFLNQEFDKPEEIKHFCSVNFNITFPMFEKVDVNGEREHPLFTFLKEKQGGLFGSAIKWNFTKFLVDREGNPVKRFAPKDKPESFESEIVKLL